MTRKIVEAIPVPVWIFLHRMGVTARTVSIVGGPVREVSFWGRRSCVLGYYRDNPLKKTR